MAIESIVEIRGWEYKFHELPESLRICFSSAERLVYERGAGAIRDRLSATCEPAILDVCSLFPDTYPFRVYIEDFVTCPRLWFSLSNIRLKNAIRLMLPKAFDEICLPERILRIYEGVGALTSGSSHFPKLTTPMRVYLKGRNHNYWSVISFGNADLLVVSEDARVSYWNHAEDELTDVPLEVFLDPFLKELFSYEDFDPDF